MYKYNINYKLYHYSCIIGNWYDMANWNYQEMRKKLFSVSKYIDF